MKTNSRFEMMQRIEKLIIENLQILHDAKCRQFHFCQDNISIFHTVQNIEVLIADVQNEDNSIFYIMQNVHFFIFHRLNENKYHILHGA